jgi:hypothetical protein
MSTFAILTRVAGQNLEGYVAAAYPDNHYVWSPSVVFVQSSGTAREISERVGITRKDAAGNLTGAINQAVVVEIKPSYWGFTDQTLWGWLKSSFETPNS